MAFPSSNRLFVGAVVGFVLLAVVAGLLVIGSPGEARARRLDGRRLNDLREISMAVDAYRNRYGRLPHSLEEVARESGVAAKLQDVTTAQPYAYRTIDARSYELCATFDRPSGGEFDYESAWPPDPQWTHGAGRHCFRRKAPEEQS